MVDRRQTWCLNRVTRYDPISIWEIDMGYGLMIWEMTTSIRSSPISMWDIMSLWSDAVFETGRSY